MDTTERSDRDEEVVERAVAATDVAEGPNTEPKGLNHPTTQSVVVQMGEDRHLNEPVEESRDNMAQLGKAEGNKADIATDMEEDEVRVGEVEAEEQMMSTQTALGEKQCQYKEGEMRKGGEV
jgi:hypothetical protein